MKGGLNVKGVCMLDSSESHLACITLIGKLIVYKITKPHSSTIDSVRIEWQASVV